MASLPRPWSPELRRHQSVATRVPSSPELCRHLTFATRAPSSPELRRHLSFATRAPPSPEFHLPPELRRHPRFTTRVPPSSELYLSPELHLHLPRVLHSMYFPFKPLPTTGQPLFLATTTGPGVVATICSDHPGNISSTSAATAPMALPLQTATTGDALSSWPLPPTPASSHHRPAGAYFADSCNNRAGRSAP